MRISDWSSDVCSSDLVPQKMRGRGYGRALLDKVIVECRRRNVRRIYLEVRSDNENAVMLYESAGFRPVGRRCGYYRGKDAVLRRSEEHTSELQSLMRISYAVFCLKKQKHISLTIYPRLLVYYTKSKEHYFKLTSLNLTLLHFHI